jgi:uncharacterized SAM-binding protein YcdF (DUF218 family)
VFFFLTKTLSVILMPSPKRGERWVLVTSAYHMPRLIGIFRKVGFRWSHIRSIGGPVDAAAPCSLSS